VTEPALAKGPRYLHLVWASFQLLLGLSILSRLAVTKASEVTGQGVLLDIVCSTLLVAYALYSIIIEAKR
jgi:hypothetical protein